MRLFFLPWVVFFLPWGFSFCREVFLCFSFWLEVNSFAVTIGWATVSLKFCSQRFLIFFNMWVFVSTSTNFAHLVSFHYSSHRIRGLVRPKNAGHFCMSDNWKQSFQNTAFCNCCLPRTRRRCNLISSLHTLPSTMTVTTWEELKVQV